MIIGYLVPGLLMAVLSAAVALLTGYGILAAFGFYMLGGSVTMAVTICAALCYRMACQPKMLAIEA